MRSPEFREAYERSITAVMEFTFNPALLEAVTQDVGIGRFFRKIGLKQATLDLELIRRSRALIPQGSMNGGILNTLIPLGVENLPPGEVRRLGTLREIQAPWVAGRACVRPGK